MPNAIELQDLFVGTLSGAGVVLMGAFYALFYALGKLHHRRDAIVAAGAAYAGLVACTYALIDALQLQGFWIWVIVVMLLGYLFAPHAIWHLCVGTHAEQQLDSKG